MSAGVSFCFIVRITARLRQNYKYKQMNDASSLSLSGMTTRPILH